MSRSGDRMVEGLAAELERAREQTNALLGPLRVDELTEQVSPLQSPLVWDLAHIGHFEELWLLREIGGEEPADGRHDDVYDAFAHARAERGELPLLDPAAAQDFVSEVRERTLRLLDRIELDPENPLLADGFVYRLVIQHELQHQETMLQTLALRERAYPPPPGPAPACAPGEVLVEGGTVTVGSDDPWAYDNERPPHEVELQPFRIDASPVSNRDWVAFIEAGGYDDPSHWCDEGWAWREQEQVERPHTWLEESARRRFGHVEPLHPDEPVQHVSWYEADAYARFAGKRLPTETEWETAALAGAFERAPSGVWEWTASHFLPYPGFHPFPYPEYSEVFFGDQYRVLRGGSWATDPVVARLTFRNWDYPQRRQIFSGVRCALDV